MLPAFDRSSFILQPWALTIGYRATQPAPLNLRPSTASPLAPRIESEHLTKVTGSRRQTPPPVCFLCLLGLVIVVVGGGGLCLFKTGSHSKTLAWSLLAFCPFLCRSGVPGLHGHTQLPLFPDPLRLPSAASTLVLQCQVWPGTSWKVLSLHFTRDHLPRSLCGLCGVR